MRKILHLGKLGLQSASLWTMIGTGLRVGGGLLTLPLALRTIPQREMGLYYTIMGIIGLATLLDLGFAITVVRNAAYAMGGAKSFSSSGVPEMGELEEPNWRLLGQLKNAVQKCYWILGAILVLVLLTAGTAFIARQIEEAGLSRSLLLCWGLFSISAAYSFLTSFWQDLLIGIGAVRAYAINGLIAQSIGLSLLIAGLLGGIGLWAYAISILVSSVIGRILCKRDLLRAAPLLKTPSPGPMKSTLAALWPMTWRQGAVVLGAFLIQRANTIVCSAKLGLEATASYGLSVNILSLIFQVAAIPMMMAWPTVSRLRVKGDSAAIRRIFFPRVYSGLAAALVGVLFLSFAGQDILQWLGSKTPLLPSPLLLLFGFILWLEHHHSQYGNLVLSENRNPFLIPALLSGLAIFGISWWAAGLWGVLGLIAAQGAIQLLWNNWWTVLRGLEGLRRVNLSPPPLNPPSQSADQPPRLTAP